MKRLICLLMVFIVLFSSCISFASNDDSRGNLENILQHLDVNLDFESVELCKDEFFFNDKEVYKCKVSDNSYVIFDNDYNLLCLNQLNDSFYGVKNNKSNFDSVDELILFIEDNIVKDKCLVTSKYMIDEKTLSIRYSKVIENIIDTTNYYHIFIDVSTLQILLFYHCCNENDYVLKDIIGIKAVEAIIDSNNYDHRDFVIELELVDGKRLSIENKDGAPSLVYVAKSDEFIFFIDASTGVIISKDISKSLGGMYWCCKFRLHSCEW